MRENHPLQRREFLKAAAAAAAMSSLEACTRGGSVPGGFLTAHERQALSAMCERIIPADEFPGAAETGVVAFIDRQLATHFTDYQALYRLGLRAVDLEAARTHGQRLADLPPALQDDALRALESNTSSGPSWQDVEPGTFFRLVVAHTMYGYYGDPRHGANPDGQSWRMIGLPHPPLRGRDRYVLQRPPRRSWHPED